MHVKRSILIVRAWPCWGANRNPKFSSLALLQCNLKFSSLTLLRYNYCIVLVNKFTKRITFEIEILSEFYLNSHSMFRIPSFVHLFRIFCVGFVFSVSQKKIVEPMVQKSFPVNRFNKSTFLYFFRRK